jgi:hypothetical protein
MDTEVEPTDAPHEPPATADASTDAPVVEQTEPIPTSPSVDKPQAPAKPATLATGSSLSRTIITPGSTIDLPVWKRVFSEL